MQTKGFGRPPPQAKPVLLHAELRQMRHKADSDKKEAALADKTMQSIEAKAKKQYEQDMAAAEASASGIGDWVCSPPYEPVTGLPIQAVAERWITTMSWPCQVLDVASGYLYNAAQRFYYSRCVHPS